jgi:hypothetical protein
MSIAAKAVFGINSIKCEANNTKLRMKKPWKKWAHLVLAPLFTFDELLATSDIMGSPPKIAEIVFPIPTAIKSFWY